MQMSAGDDVALAFMEKEKHVWTNTVKLKDLVGREGEFAGMFFVGGHGRMYSFLFFSFCFWLGVLLGGWVADGLRTAVFDLASNPVSLALIQSFAAAKKPIAAVCHGPAALMNATAPSGVPLLQSASVTGFSNLEEEQMGTANVMPFMLETELNRITGGGYVKADQPLGEKVVVSKTAETGAPLITGQNPASTPGVARELLKALGL